MIFLKVEIHILKILAYGTTVFSLTPHIVYWLLIKNLNRNQVT